MKKVLFLSPLFTVFSLAYATETHIILESSVIKIADGTFINANEIEFIRKFRRKLLEYLLGEALANNQRKGKYNLLGKAHTIESLARIEQEIADLSDKQSLLTKSALQELLTIAKADFIVQSNEFIESGRGAKNIMTVLIQEDCNKRGRPNSLLLEWARTKEGQESTMFEHHVTTFGHYYHFLKDLVNFLLDLTHSCPKAEAQFKDRVAKWTAIKELLPAIIKKAHAKGDHFNEVEFLKYLKERYLDSLVMSEINPRVIAPLLTEYIKHTHA